MKVLCIVDNQCLGLTIGKWYEVIEGNDFVIFDGEDYKNTDYYWVISDRGSDSCYPKWWFKTKGEIRDEKLGELGI